MVLDVADMAMRRPLNLATGAAVLALVTAMAFFMLIGGARALTAATPEEPATPE